MKEAKKAKEMENLMRTRNWDKRNQMPHFIILSPVKNKIQLSKI